MNRFEEYSTDRRCDFYAHMETCKELAEGLKLKKVYECGFRSGVSTWAFLSAGVERVLSIDIDNCDSSEHEAFAKEQGISFAFRKKDSTKYKPRESPFGLTLLDTLHNYEQVKAELDHVSKFTQEYICIHDTDKRWERQGRTRSAIDDFLQENENWGLHSHTEQCHGFTVLVRIMG